MVRQLADEADRVREDRRAGAVHLPPPQLGVEGGEEAVLGEGPGRGQPVEQGRLAGVRIAGQRHRGDAVPPAPLDTAGALDLREVLLQPADAVAQDPAVLLELLLTLAAALAEAAALAREVAPLPGQAGEHVLEPGQLHLGARLTAASPLIEEVQDQRAAVHHGQLRRLLQVLDLAPREVVVEQQQVGPQLAGGVADLLGLAAADEGGRVRRLARLHGPPHHHGSRRVGELSQLVQVLLDDVTRLARQDEAYQERPPGARETGFFKVVQIFSSLCGILGKSGSGVKADPDGFNAGASL